MKIRLKFFFVLGVFMKRLCLGRVFALNSGVFISAIFVSIVVAFQSVAYAASMTYEGSLLLNNTTSIAGTTKNDIFFFRLTLDGDSIDELHIFDEINGGVSTVGRFEGAVTGFEMTRGEFNSGTWDPSALTYDFAGSTILAYDANPSLTPDPEHPEYSLWNEHLFISLRVETPDSPLHILNFNLYNGLFHEPFATRQLWLDTSTPDNGFTLDDLFLHGMETLSEFEGIRDWEGKALVDSVFWAGDADSNGAWASGTVQSLAAVPIPATIWLFGSGLLGLFGIAKRKKA